MATNQQATTSPKYVLTPPGLLSFPSLFQPRPPAPGAEPRYSAAIVFDEEAQKSEAFQTLGQMIIDCAKAEFGQNVNLKSLRFPIRDAAEKEYSGFGPGKKFIQPWTKNRPGLVDANLDPITDPSAVWGGQIVRASVTPFAYATSGNKGVALGLRHIQVLRMDMPRLDGRGTAEGDFGNAPLPKGFDTPAEDMPFFAVFV
jgi:hypothetical protein